jgi:hypothetical protein
MLNCVAALWCRRWLLVLLMSIGSPWTMAEICCLFTFFWWQVKFMNWEFFCSLFDTVSWGLRVSFSWCRSYLVIGINNSYCWMCSASPILHLLCLCLGLVRRIAFVYNGTIVRPSCYIGCIVTRNERQLSSLSHMQMLEFVSDFSSSHISICLEFVTRLSLLFLHGCWFPRSQLPKCWKAFMRDE